MLLPTVRAALVTVPRCLRRSCRVEDGVVTLRRRDVSVHRTRSILVVLMPSLWRARLTRDTMFSTPFRSSEKPTSCANSKLRSSIVAWGGDDFFLVALAALLF